MHQHNELWEVALPAVLSKALTKALTPDDGSDDASYAILTADIIQATHLSGQVLI